MMGQIHPAEFQSPMCMFYVYEIVEMKYFWVDLTWLFFGVHKVSSKWWRKHIKNWHILLQNYGERGPIGMIKRRRNPSHDIIKRRQVLWSVIKPKPESS